MRMHPSVAQHIPKIQELAEAYGVARLEVFGSAMTDRFDPATSDVDFIVHYPDDYEFGYFGKNLFELEEKLSEILKRPAQLVMTSALQKDYFRHTADLTRTTIYVGDDSEAATVGNPDPVSLHH